MSTFENLDAREPADLATFDLDADPTSTGPLTALGWLAFTVLLLLSPALVLAVWSWAV